MTGNIHPKTHDSFDGVVGARRAELLDLSDTIKRDLTLLADALATELRSLRDEAETALDDAPPSCSGCCRCAGCPHASDKH